MTDLIGGISVIPVTEYLVRGYADGTVEYALRREIDYWSERYQKRITVPFDYPSDGASGALDIPGSQSWWVHDRICDRPAWDDNTPISAWQAARVLSDILLEEGRQSKNLSRVTSTARGYYWFWATYLFGCKAARKNGWY